MTEIEVGYYVPSEHLVCSDNEYNLIQVPSGRESENSQKAGLRLAVNEIHVLRLGFELNPIAGIRNRLNYLIHRLT